MRVRCALVVAALLGGCASAPVPARPPSPSALGAGTWISESWSDPRFQLDIPGGWVKGDPTQTTAPESLPSMTPQLSRAVAWGNEMATTGRYRLLVYGPLVTAQATLDGGFVGVYVESGDASLAAFAARTARLVADVFGATAIDRSEVTVPAGPAVRLAYAAQLGDPSTAYEEVDYLLVMPDGRSMRVAVSGNGPAATAAAVAEFAAKVIGTLRPLP